MKPKDEVIAQARVKLEKINSLRKEFSKLPRGMTEEDYNDLVFIATGEKETESPIEPYDSNRSFFHLKEIPCTLTCGGKVETGLFTHEDYALFYEFKRADGSVMYFRGGPSFRGKMEYVNWKPNHLRLTTNEAPSTRELIIANGSLTSSSL
jgi:hypothetical protein